MQIPFCGTRLASTPDEKARRTEDMPPYRVAIGFPTFVVVSLLRDQFPIYNLAGQENLGIFWGFLGDFLGIF